MSAMIHSSCCELLQNVYLCISTYNFATKATHNVAVVNCFKMCIFALARTTVHQNLIFVQGCELLQNVYLCISTYNLGVSSNPPLSVVNCFKMCIFALARTTILTSQLSWRSCELLQNVYLCISTYNSSLAL